ncbi:hypothetical protein [Faecalibaculum rodentium]|uniref:hypothetical protein n=1 Tax=Faecalibaculum rodentium TaxID=1702221 RepID=UPI00272D2BF6|nr:hypothetical protein [Faecalibaculum rodentium]
MQTLRTQYSVDAFCHEKDEASQNLVSNLICNLAACDILLYLFSSFTPYGSIEVVLAREITMNTVAAMEALVLRTVRQPGLPLKHMNHPGGARQMVQRLQKRGLIPEETRQQFDRLYDLRNRIHLRHANELRRQIQQKDGSHDAGRIRLLPSAHVTGAGKRTFRQVNTENPRSCEDFGVRFHGGPEQTVAASVCLRRR